MECAGFRGCVNAWFLFGCCETSLCNSFPRKIQVEISLCVNLYVFISRDILTVQAEKIQRINNLKK